MRYGGRGEGVATRGGGGEDWGGELVGWVIGVWWAEWIALGAVNGRIVLPWIRIDLSWNP